MKYRRRERELVLRAIFSSIFFSDKKTDNIWQNVLNSNEILKKIDLDYSKTLFYHTVEFKNNELDSLQKVIKNWSLDRLSYIDKAIIFVACAEIKYMEQKPAIAINEAVELAKKYSDKKSTKFINAVIDNWQKQ